MWNFNVTELLFVFLEDWTDALITSKMPKKIKVSRKLGGGNTKNLFAQTILGTILGTK